MAVTCGLWRVRRSTVTWLRAESWHTKDEVLLADAAAFQDPTSSAS